MQPILKINLTTGETGLFTAPRDWVRDYLGAASLAARILYDHLTPDLDPLSPEAPLLFINGPLTGTAGPSTGRFVVCARSPATGLWGESNIGGFWGPELRKAGFDGLWVTGRAPRPVYIRINDGEVEIRDASHLWGLDTYQTQSAVQAETPAKNVRVASIGPAGESQIPFALILCDHGRVAGRTGMGAVMGAKNLKAIAVKGTAKVPVIDWEMYKPLRASANRELRSHNQTDIMRDLGSASASDYFDYLGEMPKKYFQAGTFDGTYNVSGSTIAETILSGVSACHACVIACGRVVTLKDSKKRKGPEYETLVGFGPNLLIDDPAAITRLGERCDRYGIDTISMSNTIGLAFTLFEGGKITGEDTGGLALEWGSVAAVEECLRQTVRREGFGAHLAGGARELETRYGDGGDAVQVNGLEVPYHDPRGASGMALVYATSPRGACHNQSDYFMVDVLGHVEEDQGLNFYARHDGAVKAANVARHQDWRTVHNALVLCVFARVPVKTILELTNAALGLDMTPDDLIRSGERAWNLKRAINNRLGLTRANDTLPKPLLKPYEDGGSAGFVPDLQPMLEAYYEARGWDKVNGYPAREKLVELGLDWVVEDLWPET
ncbi:MAG: aldehyde ferredoxin oxidoreductase family protein [Anaerolineales bacterium]